jgi:hypothetical protein
MLILPHFKFPKALPPDIADLPRHQAVEYSHTLFDATMQKILVATSADRRSARRRVILFTGIVVAAVALAATAAFVYSYIAGTEKTSISTIPSPSQTVTMMEPDAQNLVAGASERNGSQLFGLHYQYQRIEQHFAIDYRLPYLDLLRQGGPVVGYAYKKNPFIMEWPRLLTTVANNRPDQIVLTSVVLNITKSALHYDVIPVFDDGSVNSLVIVNHGWGTVVDPKLTFEIQNDQDQAPGSAPAHNEISLPTFPATRLVQLGKYLAANSAQSDFARINGEFEYGATGERQKIKFSTTVKLTAAFGAALPPAQDEYGVFFKSGEIGRIVIDLQAPRQIKSGEADTFYLRIGTDRSSITDMSVNFLTNDGTEIKANDLTIDLFAPRFADIKWQQGLLGREK